MRLDILKRKVKRFANQKIKVQKLLISSSCTFIHKTNLFGG